MTKFRLEYRRRDDALGAKIRSRTQRAYRDDPGTNAGNGWIWFRSIWWNPPEAYATLDVALKTVRARWPEPEYIWRGYHVG